MIGKNKWYIWVPLIKKLNLKKKNSQAAFEKWNIGYLKIDYFMVFHGEMKKLHRKYIMRECSYLY